MNSTVHLKAVGESRGNLRHLIRREDLTAFSNPYRQTSFAISLHYMDQVTWGARRLRSLQCWAAQLNRTMQVLEPSMNATYLGAPVDKPVDKIWKFSNFFDINLWNRYASDKLGYPPLMNWDDFFLYAPRETILVEFLYQEDQQCFEGSFQNSSENCTFNEVRQYWSNTLDELSFSVIREVCIDFRNVTVFSKNLLNDNIFGNISIDTPVTIVFNDWRGPLRDYRTKENDCIIRIRDPECSPSGPTGLMHNITLNALKPSPEIYRSADIYISKYLGRSRYIAVMIRWELMFTEFIYNGGSNLRRSAIGKRCQRKIIRYVQGLGLRTVFVATDVGKYGSRFMQANTTLYNHSYYETGKNLTEHLFKALGQRMTLEQYDQRFDEFSGTTTHPTYYIPQLQKVIAARAECLILVGWGSFHENTLDLYKSLRKGGNCYKKIVHC